LRRRALELMRPTQPMHSSSKAPLTKLSPMKQIRICAMRTSEIVGNDCHKTKEAGSDAPSLFDPRQFLFL
jgi:hypothetical protein